MRLSKTISALFLSFVILFASLTQANAKRLHAAIADWTGGITVSYTHLTLPTKRIV